jgi:N utilization substance protein B
LKKSTVTRDRHRARELAVQLLYSLSARPGRNAAECWDAFVSEEGFAPEESDDVREYLRFLTEGVWRRRFEIDTAMRGVMVGWSLEHMVAVDKAILRIAIFEGFMEKKIPLPVAISEAVGLACAFGTEESGRFVNGILGKMARLMEEKSKDDKETAGTKINGNKVNGKMKEIASEDDHAASASEISIDRR